MTMTIRLMQTVVFILVALCAPMAPADDKAAEKPSNRTLPEWVELLDSQDGQQRVAATRALFAGGKEAIAALRDAGAKQIAPFGTISSPRRHVVYSLLVGLRPNPPKAKAGYLTGSFGLHVEKDVTAADIRKMGRRHGFELRGTFNAKGRPQAYVQLAESKKLAEVLKAVLTEEPGVVTVNLNYFEG